MPFDGVLIINKPEGITSHDAVREVKRSLSAAKVGHTGTLDPFATGVLVMGINQGTKLIPFLDKTEKAYRAVMVLGASTDTYDLTGKIVTAGDISGITEQEIVTVFSRFVGDILQHPPIFSAIKVDGVRLYKLARSGVEMPLPEARPVHIRMLRPVDFSPPRVSFEVVCSPGTYIRSLAADIGRALGTEAYLEQLSRTASGPFTLEAAHELSEFTALGLSGYGAVIGLREAVADMMEIPISEQEAALVANGGFLCWSRPNAMRTGATVKLVHEGRLVALAKVMDRSIKANLKPFKVFV
jgi:tRNA pseudouridine55 synthase